MGIVLYITTCAFGFGFLSCFNGNRSIIFAFIWVLYGLLKSCDLRDQQLLGWGWECVLNLVEIEFGDNCSFYEGVFSLHNNRKITPNL